MDKQVNRDAKSHLQVIEQSELAAIAGGWNDMFFDYKTMTGVIFYDEGIAVHQGSKTGTYIPYKK